MRGGLWLETPDDLPGVWGLKGGEVPAFAVGAFDKLGGLGGVGAAEGGGVPGDFFADAVGDIAEVIGFGEASTVFEVAGGRGAGFAGEEPFGVVADAFGDGSSWPSEVFEFLLGEEEMFAVVGEEHAFFADKEATFAPLGDFLFSPELGFNFALIPSDAAGGETGAWTIFVGGAHGGGGEFEVCGAFAGLDGFWGIEFEGPEGEIIPVGAEVAHRATAEVPPAVPFGAGDVDFVEGSGGGGAEKEIPVEVCGRGFGFGGAFGDEDDVAVAFGGFFGLEAPSAGDPDVAFADGADGACLDEFDDSAVVGLGVNLGSHLGGDLGFTSGFANFPTFPDVMGEGFFAIDMLFHPQGWEGGKGVGMFGGADGDGVEVFEGVVELAKVGEGFCLGVLFGGGGEVASVDIAKGDDIFASGGDRGELGAAASTAPDDGDIEFVIQSLGAEQCGGDRGGEDGGEELATWNAHWEVV